MLCHRLRRWPNINPALAERLVLAGMYTKTIICIHLDSIAIINVLQSQRAVTAHFVSKKLVYFGFAEQWAYRYGELIGLPIPGAATTR